jgi:hypothetical protein
MPEPITGLGAAATTPIDTSGAVPGAAEPR